MKTSWSQNRRARVWLLLGVLACAGIAATAWQYDRAVRQVQLNHDLLEAVTDGRVREVQTLLREGANPNARELPETSPAAPWEALLATVQRLWRHQPPAPRQIYPTALLVAVQSQVNTGVPEAAVVQALLDHGANPDAFLPATSAETPLWWAVQASQLQTVRELLEKHASVQCRSNDGDTLLHLAIHANSQRCEIPSLLLNHGADVSARNTRGETPLIIAASLETSCSDGSLPLLKLLLKQGADVRARDCSEETALSNYVQIDADDPGNRGTLTALIDAGADVNSETNYQVSILQESVNNQKIFNFLLAHGAKIFTVHDPNGADLLMRACSVFDQGQENYGIIETLLARGVSINAADKDGTTALLATAGRPVFESNSSISPQAPDSVGVPAVLTLITYLLAHGATVDAKDRQGHTALMFASEASDIQAELMLLTHGANINARDKYGQTALIHAVAKGNTQAVRILLAQGANNLH